MTTPIPRPQPVPTPETKHFWDGPAIGELQLQRCHGCSSVYFPPQPFCPSCGSDAIEIVRAWETAEIGTVAQSALGLATQAARRALADCGLTPADVDGVAISGLNPYLPTIVAHSLGIEARWVDATMVGGCSNLVHLRHAI